LSRRHRSFQKGFHRTHVVATVEVHVHVPARWNGMENGGRLEVGSLVMSIPPRLKSAIPDLKLAADFAAMDRPPDLPRDKDTMGPSGGR
jgi:hypothetical protein